MKKAVKKLMLSKETLRDADGGVPNTHVFAATCVTCGGSICTPTCLLNCH